MFLVIMLISPRLSISSWGGDELLLNECRISSESICFRIPCGSSTLQRLSFEIRESVHYHLDSVFYCSNNPHLYFTSIGIHFLNRWRPVVQLVKGTIIAIRIYKWEDILRTQRAVPCNYFNFVVIIILKFRSFGILLVYRWCPVVESVKERS